MGQGLSLCIAATVWKNFSPLRSEGSFPASGPSGRTRKFCYAVYRFYSVDV